MRALVSKTAVWIEHRTGLQSAISGFLLEDIPASAGWPEVFGSVALFLFLIQCLTGILLALNYAPTPGEAYNSVAYIMRQVAGGRMVHGLHHWGASLMIIVVFTHMAQVFVFGAFKKPREATWIAGVTLLLLTLGFGLTGYLLPWDNKAYWGTVVTTKIVASLPFIGPMLTRFLGAANGVDALTFSRFYTLHTLLLPAMTAGLVAIHVYLVRRHGITPAQVSTEEKQKFYPKQLFRDLFAVFIAFLCLYFAASFLEVPLDRMADPTDTNYVPRPEWYFLFLFQLLKLFPGRLELIGTLILPSMAVLALILLPFLRRAHTTILKGRFQSACVVALAFSIWFGLTSAAGWTPAHPKGSVAVSSQAAEWARLSPEVIAGSGYFRSAHCDSCHDLIVGTPKPGPTLGLTPIRHPRDWMFQHFSDQSQAGSGGGESFSLPMPQQNALLIFVASVKPKSLQTLAEVSPEFSNGAQVFVTNACASCHKVNGIGGDTGPSLNGLGNRRSESWVRAHFGAPSKLSPGSIMPPYHLSQNDERDLIGYLFSLSQ
ncbi:MAG TPA: cytochrome b N-terminal domain-containing protein [Bryobacteraceae bacterium]|jgi:ubiquinol-cytochrome c reductase cytochrome b subunit|nr:cytochrome b N-terminal domain-containing protein [Bryobacteraceae bacterium]